MENFVINKDCVEHIEIEKGTVHKVGEVLEIEALKIKVFFNKEKQ